MRTLEEMLATLRVDNPYYAQNVTMVREAHALGRSEMEAEVEREKADATHAREGFYACQREMDLARAEVERLMALLAETRAQMQSRIDKLLDPVVRVRTMQPVPPIPLTLDASTAALEAEVAKLRAERDEWRESSRLRTIDAEEATEERCAAEARAAEAEKALDQVMTERDRREEDIESVAQILGCKEEWTNCHDHGECAQEASAELVAELARLRAEGEERERALREALGWFVQFHSGHVLPPELAVAMTGARAALRPHKEEP